MPSVYGERYGRVTRNDVRANLTLHEPATGSAHPSDHGLRIPERIDELDGIRGVAVVLVILHHISQAFPAGHPSALLRVWLQATHAGWLGVDIFFALSGFLITRTLLGTRLRPYYYRNFYMRRLLRLMPPYLLTLLLVGLLVPHSAAFLLLSVAYLANFSTLFGVPMVYGPLWSLAVEEHFYLLWPSLVRFLRRRTMLLISLAVVTLSPLARFYAQRRGFFNPYYSWFRLDGLLWGAMLATLIATPRATRRIVAAWSLSAGSAGIAFFLIGVRYGAMARASVLGSSVVFGLVAMATSGLIGVSALGMFPRLLQPLRSAPLRFLGDISYWLYLIHSLVLDLVLRRLPTLRTDGARYATIVLLVFMPCILSGVIVRKWVELPALSLKSRFR